MHPTDEELIAWALGDVAGGHVKEHLATSCPECAERVRHLEGVLAVLRSDRDAEAPESWVARAVRLFEGHAAADSLPERIRGWGRGLAEQAARLVADTAATAVPAFGVRAAGAARRLRFETPEVELDLELEPGAGAVRVTGQFASLSPEPEPLAGGRYLLVTGSGACREGTTDDLGEFDARLDDARDLSLRVIHGGKVVTFQVPEPRKTE